MGDRGLLHWQICIVGGGLAGLSLSIQLAKAGYAVVLFEKEKYPFHKVCGEYISMESRDFIEQLGLPLSRMNLPVIKKLIVSSPNGNNISSNLDTGGFGISRHTLDSELYKIALQSGVEVFQETKVNDISFTNDVFTISTSAFDLEAKVVVAAFGKRSNLDIKLGRAFTRKKQNKLNNYLGVKYHIRTSLIPETIALHNFKNGYCGISQIEDNKYCLCYLTTAANLKANNNSISAMEKNVLQKNPFLKDIFLKSTFLYSAPLTISQISFDKKTLVENHILMTGDAAGMVTPLCGNGMSMAFHAAKIAFENIDRFLKKHISRSLMEKKYQDQWNKCFGKRLWVGRFIQKFFGRSRITNAFIGAIKYFPFFIRKLIRSTHGRSF